MSRRVIICNNCGKKVTARSLLNDGNFSCPKCGANCNKEVKENKK